MPSFILSPIQRLGCPGNDAPTVYIDDTRYISMRSNGWSWLEVAPGTRRLTMRRPLGAVLGFEGMDDFALSLIVDAKFDVQPGGVYYFRYSEDDTPKEPNPALASDDPLSKGDMQLVSWEVAYPEIINTRFMDSRPRSPRTQVGRILLKTIWPMYLQMQRNAQKPGWRNCPPQRRRLLPSQQMVVSLYVRGSLTKRVKADADLKSCRSVRKPGSRKWRSTRKMTPKVVLAFLSNWRALNVSMVGPGVKALGPDAFEDGAILKIAVYGRSCWLFELFWVFLRHVPVYLLKNKKKFHFVVDTPGPSKYHALALTGCTASSQRKPDFTETVSVLGG